MSVQPEFIGRSAWLERFDTLLTDNTSEIWRITGRPGVGKSSLLDQFSRRCEQAKRRSVWLDLHEYQVTQGLDVLTDLAGSARFFDAANGNKSLRETLGEHYKAISGGIVGGLKLGQSLIPGGELIANGAATLLALGNGLAERDAQLSEQFAAAQPELFLLEALAAAGQHTPRPVCLIDSYEHILQSDSDIQSRLHWSAGDARSVNTARTMPVAQWFSHLLHDLQQHGWLVVACGRNIPHSKAEDAMQGFNDQEMMEAAKQRPDLRYALAEQPEAMLSLLQQVSFGGNPLWLQLGINLVEHLLEQGQDIAELAAQPDVLQRLFEDHDPFDLGACEGIEHGRYKLALLQRLSHNLAGMEDSVWKIALPRWLERPMVEAIFPEQAQSHALLHRLEIAGVFRHSGSRFFSLHEEVRDLLLADARQRGLLASREARDCHEALWQYLCRSHLQHLDEADYTSIIKGLFNPNDSAWLQAHKAIPEDWLFDASYHRIMALERLPLEDVTPADFWQALAGSVFLSLWDKFRVVFQIPNSHADQCRQHLDRFADERQRLQITLGKQSAEALLVAFRRGEISSFHDMDFWQQRVQHCGQAGDYLGFVFALDEQTCYNEILGVVDAMLQRYGDSEAAAVQAQCAEALVNKGVTLRQQMNDAAGAIATYDALLQRYGDSEDAAVQAQCAKALYNKGWTLGEKMNDAAGAIAAYDALLQRYGDSEAAAVQEQCAKALVNKGWTLGEKMNDAAGEIATYDALLQRYGDSEAAAVQEQCAKALYNKGWTLGNQMNDVAGAIAAYDALLQRYGDSEDAAVQAQCAEALFSKGVTLVEKMDDAAGAIAAYDALLQRYGDSEDAAVQERCAKALLNKGLTFGNQMNDATGEIAAYDALLQRYGDSEDAAVQAQCAKALFNKGWTLGEKMNDAAGEIATYDALLQRYGDSEDAAVQMRCAKTLYNKGMTLCYQMNDAAGAIATWDALLQRYSDSEDAVVQESCANALYSKGVTLLQQMNDAAGAIAAWDTLLQRYGDSEDAAVQDLCAMALAIKDLTLKMSDAARM
jgi:tetratricopeptide (TPR) repeat protein